MSPEKLQALQKLATDERTPIDEARNAALQFVRHGGASQIQSVTIDDVRRLADAALVRMAFGPELEALKREEESKRTKLQNALNAMEKERNAAQSETVALRKQLDDLRAHGNAILAFLRNDAPVKQSKAETSTFPADDIFFSRPTIFKY